MNELRKDYLLDRWVIIAKGRGKRPQHFVQKPHKVEEKLCFFCPGNESSTPPEIARVDEKGKWIIRTFPNKFPATDWHEVIVETPNHGKHLGDLSVGHIAKVLGMYSERQRAIEKNSKVEYVSIFKNSGEMGGASLPHSHTQLIGLRMVPPLIKKETGASKGDCPFCRTWKDEVKSDRLVYEDEYTAAFAPFASRFPFEAWVMPKRHVGALDEMDKKETDSFAGALKKILSALNSSLNYPPYNFVIHHAPEGKDLHLHLELLPRLSRFAGFEFDTEIVINTMPPEVAAEHYRGEIDGK
ncbi:MAG: DUF4931 domain-containing protein [Candidatus Altiarchaeota archaeon]|nr:DUF4931 domain-containing protein [Candidatus Altiarchaeota archaeon]